MSTDAAEAERPPRFTIAVLDDLPVTGQLIALILRTNLDCRVQIFSTAEELLEQPPDKMPDLYLLDIMLEGGSGIDVCRRLREDPKRRRIPVVFLSAHGRPEVRVAALQAGGNDYLDKPFYPEELLVRVRAQLALHASELFNEQQLKKTETELLAWREMLLPLLGEVSLFLAQVEDEEPGLAEQGGRLRERLREVQQRIRTEGLVPQEATEWHPSRFRLAPLLREAASRVEADCARKGVSLEVVCPEEGTCFFDAEFLRDRLLVHLLRDAIRHSFPGKSVCLEARAIQRAGSVGWEIHLQDGSEEDREVHVIHQLMARYQPAAMKPGALIPGSTEWLTQMQLSLHDHGAQLRVSSSPGKGRSVDIRIWDH